MACLYPRAAYWTHAIRKVRGALLCVATPLMLLVVFRFIFRVTSACSVGSRTAGLGLCGVCMNIVISIMLVLMLRSLR